MIPTHIAKPKEDLTGYTEITVTVASVEYFEKVITSIHKLVNEHPEWQTKIT